MTDNVLSLEDKIERRTAIKELVRDMNELGAEFEAVSEGRKSITNRAKALGLNKAGFQFAVKLSEMDEVKRKALVATLVEVSDALAINLQLTLELTAAGPDDDEHDTSEEDAVHPAIVAAVEADQTEAEAA